MTQSSKIQSLIEETAELIASYDAPLATMWLQQPFQRTNIARAFAHGYKSTRNICALLEQVADLDGRCTRLAGVSK